MTSALCGIRLGLGNEAAFNAAIATLNQADVSWRQGSAEQCEQQGVQALVHVTDPSGNRHELSWGHRSDCQPFVSPPRRAALSPVTWAWATCVLPAPNFDATLAACQGRARV